MSPASLQPASGTHNSSRSLSPLEQIATPELARSESCAPTPSQCRALTALSVALLLGLGLYSVYLARHRIYQVDECQNLYMAGVLAKGKAAEFFTNASLFLLGPLSWLAEKCDHAQDFFTASRLLFLAPFWVNILLIAKIAGGRLRSVKGMLALAGAATLAPLWDYGFEIRHDNLVLTGLLLTWWLVRGRPASLISYGLAGAVAVALLFVAVKSVVYVVPLTLGILLFPPATRSMTNSRRRPSLPKAVKAGRADPSVPGQFRMHSNGSAFGDSIGALASVLLIRLCYRTGGKWQLYLSVFHGVAKYSAGGGGGSPRFWPWFTLNRLLPQIPLILALSVAGCIAVVTQLWRGRRAALTWKSNLPEVFLLVGALAALFMNPSPFPYNVLLLIPFAF